MAGNGHDTSSSAAFVIRIGGQAGTRAIEVTFGVPLDMTPKDLHHYVDKVCLVIDRQTFKGELQRAKMDLEQAEKALTTHVEQQATAAAKFALEWEANGRKGPWKPFGAQQQQLDNWQTTIREMRDKRIPQFRAEISKLEQVIAAEV